MVFSFSKTRYSPIAVDFGADSLKLLQVVLSDPPQIVAAAAVELPENARTDPGARNAFYVDTLKRLLNEQPFKGRKAIISIPAYATLVQQVQVAPAAADDPSELEAQIGLHLRQRMNIDPSRMVLRHFPVGQITRDGSPKLEVICLAASREAVMRFIETAHRGKLDVVGMHAEPPTIIKAFSHLYRRSDDHLRTTCFIDLGGATTKVIIAHGGDMVFAKTIHAAGDHFNKQKAQAAGIGFLEARAARIKLATDAGQAARVQVQAAVATGAAEPTVVPQPKPIRATGGLAILDAALAAEVQTVIAKVDAAERRSAPAPIPPPPSGPIPAAGSNGHESDDTLDCLVDELQLCIRYHQGNYPSRPIEKLVFLGGEANHVATCQKIARALRIGAQLGDPLARLIRTSLNSKKPMGVDMRQPQPGWAVPLGLCLSEANL